MANSVPVAVGGTLVVSVVNAGVPDAMNWVSRPRGGDGDGRSYGHPDHHGRRLGAATITGTDPITGCLFVLDVSVALPLHPSGCGGIGGSVT